MSLVTRNVRVLSIFNFCIDFRLYMPVAAIYFAHVAGSYALGAAVLSITMITSAMLDIPFGIVSDRIGRRKTVLFGAAANVISVAVYAASGSFAMLAVGAFLEGTGRALYNGNNSALLYDSLASEGIENEYHAYSSKTTSMFQVALTISALCGAFISTESLRWTLWASIAPQALAFLTAFWFIEPTAHFRNVASARSHLLQSIRNVWRRPILRRLLLANFLGYGAGETSFALSPVFVATVWPTWAVGLFRALKHALAMLSFLRTGWLIERLGAARLALSASIFDRSLGTLAVAWPTVASPLILGVTSLAYGPESVSSDVLQQKEFTDAERATMASVSTFVSSLGFAVFALSIGAVIDKFGAEKGLLVAQLVLISTIPVYWSVHRISKPQH